MNLAPLILTLTLDDTAQTLFNSLRKEHFPPERNYLDAHLTLFHNLPGNEPLINDMVTNICNTTAAFTMNVSSIVSIGNGVAYKIESPDLQAIHKRLQNEWERWLIPQDKQKLWPHITIQNKTDAVTANKLIDKLKIDFVQFTIEALGLKIWEYKNGPWEFVKEYRFNTA